MYCVIERNTQNLGSRARCSELPIRGRGAALRLRHVNDPNQSRAHAPGGAAAERANQCDAPRATHRDAPCALSTPPPRSTRIFCMQRSYVAGRGRSHGRRALTRLCWCNHPVPPSKPITFEPRAPTHIPPAAVASVLAGTPLCPCGCHEDPSLPIALGCRRLVSSTKQSRSPRSPLTHPYAREHSQSGGLPQGRARRPLEGVVLRARSASPLDEPAAPGRGLLLL